MNVWGRVHAVLSQTRQTEEASVESSIIDSLTSRLIPNRGPT
jgi:hypothetical protein